MGAGVSVDRDSDFINAYCGAARERLTLGDAVVVNRNVAEGRSQDEGYDEDDELVGVIVNDDHDPNRPYEVENYEEEFRTGWMSKDNVMRLTPQKKFRLELDKLTGSACGTPPTNSHTSSCPSRARLCLLHAQPE